MLFCCLFLYNISHVVLAAPFWLCPAPVSMVRPTQWGMSSLNPYITHGKIKPCWVIKPHSHPILRQHRQGACLELILLDEWEQGRRVSSCLSGPLLLFHTPWSLTLQLDPTHNTDPLPFPTPIQQPFTNANYSTNDDRLFRLTRIRTKTCQRNYSVNSAEHLQEVPICVISIWVYLICRGVCLCVEDKKVEKSHPPLVTVLLLWAY